MSISGANIIGGAPSALGGETFSAYDPRAGRTLDPPFLEATAEEIERALDLADSAVRHLAAIDAEAIQTVLTAIREEIHGLGDALIERAAQGNLASRSGASAASKKGRSR